MCVSFASLAQLRFVSERNFALQASAPGRGTWRRCRDRDSRGCGDDSGYAAFTEPAGPSMAMVSLGMEELAISCRDSAFGCLALSDSFFCLRNQEHKTKLFACCRK